MNPKEIQKLIETTRAEVSSILTSPEEIELVVSKRLAEKSEEIGKAVKARIEELLAELKELKEVAKLLKVKVSGGVAGKGGPKDTSTKGIFELPETGEFAKSSSIIRIFDLPGKEALHGITRKQGGVEFSKLPIKGNYLEVPKDDERAMNSVKFIESEYWKANEKRIKASKEFKQRLSEKQA